MKKENDNEYENDYKHEFCVKTDDSSSIYSLIVFSNFSLYYSYKYDTLNSKKYKCLKYDYFKSLVIDNVNNFLKEKYYEI